MRRDRSPDPAGSYTENVKPQQSLDIGRLTSRFGTSSRRYTTPLRQWFVDNLDRLHPATMTPNSRRLQ